MMRHGVSKRPVFSRQGLSGYVLVSGYVSVLTLVMASIGYICQIGMPSQSNESGNVALNRE